MNLSQVMREIDFKLLNEFITALASLLWPILILIIVLIFKDDIKFLLTRIKKGKLFGQELELETDVLKFKKAVEESREEIVETPTKGEEIESENKELDKDIVSILEAAKVSPELGIIKLSSILEREIRIYAGALGRLGKERITTTGLFVELVNQNILPKNTIESLNIFWKLRSKVVHGREAVDNFEIIRILDIGIELLKTIRSKAYEINIVYHPGVELYTDEECTNKREDVRGIILETTSSDRKSKFKRIFPTTNWGYYKKGKWVSWEWSFKKKWMQTWYIDPDTNEKKKAWDSSAEFVGRHLEDL